jgi:hypothetical protein
MAADGRSYVSGKFMFMMDGLKCGFVRNINGGDITADVIEEKAGPSQYVKKHIGVPKYSEFDMQIGFSMTKGTYDWIAASWNLNYQRKNGAIVACDHKGDARSQTEFFNALLTEVGIPACDGSSKEPAYLTMKFKPEYSRVTKASGKMAGEFGKSEQKLWLPQNFRLSIDGLDCTKVNKVDAFTVKQAIADDAIGDARDDMIEPGSLTVPSIKISMAESHCHSFVDWHENFVIKGNCDETQEKGGTLEFLSPNRQEVLLTIKFFNLGIFKLSTDKADAGGDAIKRKSAELYCERMEFAYGGKTIS